jgi:hypothetical protein
MAGLELARRRARAAPRKGVSTGKIAIIKAYFVLWGGGRGMEVPVLHLIKQEEQVSDPPGKVAAVT